MFFGNNFFFGLTIITIFLPLLAYGQSSHEQGMANNNYVPEISARIANGTQSVAGQFPYMVSVRVAYNYRDRFQCAGIILNKYWVITAAHCLHKYYQGGILTPPGHLKLVAGINSQISWWKARFKRSVSKIVEHPEWKYEEEYEKRIQRFPRDTALMKVRKPWVFNDYVKNIKIISHSLPANASCIVIGFGDTENGTTIYDLRYSKEYLYGNDFCRTHIPRNISSYYEYPDGTLCAGNLDEPTGPCRLDLAAPLVCDNRLAGYVLNILYDGMPCGTAGRTYIYFDVKYHRNWIQKEIRIQISKKSVKTSKTHTLHDSFIKFISYCAFTVYFILYYSSSVSTITLP